MVHFAALVVSTALALGQDSATVGGQPSAPAPETAIYRLLREQRDAGHRVDPELREALVPLAGRAPQAVVDVVLAQQIPPVEEGTTPQALNRYQLELALEALVAIPTPSVRLPQAAMLVESSAAEQAAALRLVGILSPVAKGESLLDLAAALLPAAPEGAEPVQPPPADRAVTGALRSALTDLLGRSAGRIDFLSRSLGNLDSRLQPAVLGAVGDLGDARALPLLDHELRRGTSPPSLSITAITRCAPSLDHDVDAQVARTVAGYLDPSDPHLCVEATRALGALKSNVGLDDLVELLDRDDDLGGQAHAALTRITGLELPHHRRVWGEWLAGEREFAARTLPALVRGLDRLDRADLAPRLRQLSGRPLARHEVAAELTVLLDHRDAAVRTAACNAIASTDSPAAVIRLAEALFEDGPVAEAALEALRILTPATDDRPLDSDGHAWLFWIESRRPRH